MINEGVVCRLRIQGSFGVRNGIKQHCMMLDKRMNVTIMESNAEESIFHCKSCPNSAKRDEMIEEYKNAPDCKSCGINIATERVPEDIEIFGGMEKFEEGDLLCMSCFSNVKMEIINKSQQNLERELQELEEKYQRGKIPYSEIISFKEKMKESKSF